MVVYLVSESRFIPGIAFRKSIYAEAAQLCLKGQEGKLTGLNYRNYNSLTYYKWSEQINVCVISDIDEHEAFESLNNLVMIVAAAGSMMFFVALFLSYLIARSISMPIKILSNVAQSIGQGDFSKVAPISSKDEIGELAKVFNDMAYKLKELYENLETEVQNRTKDLQISKDRLKAKLIEIESFNKLMVGRELRMIELKEEIKRLKEANEKFSRTDRDLE